MSQSTNRTRIKAAIVGGAEGFIGSHLVKFLHAKGWQVIGCYRLHGTTWFPKAEGCTSKGREFQTMESGKSNNSRRSWSKLEIRHLIRRAL